MKKGVLVFKKEQTPSPQASGRVSHLPGGLVSHEFRVESQQLCAEVILKEQYSCTQPPGNNHLGPVLWLPLLSYSPEKTHRSVQKFYLMVRVGRGNRFPSTSSIPGYVSST